jgi:hypothetical protein
MAPPGDYPRVSAILAAAGLAPDFADVPEAVIERARQRGISQHALIERHHYGLLGPDEAPPPAYLAFLEESGHEPLISEFEVRSERWRYVGHPDRLGWLLGRRGLFDWKFTDTLDLPSVQRQLAAYRLAWQEQHSDQPIAFCAAVQFCSTGRPKFHEFTPTEMARAENEFLAAITIWWAKERR